MGWGLFIQRRSHFPKRGVAGMLRNGWPESIGISGRNASDYAVGVQLNEILTPYFTAWKARSNFSSTIAVMRRSFSFLIMAVVTVGLTIATATRSPFS